MNEQENSMAGGEWLDGAIPGDSSLTSMGTASSANVSFEWGTTSGNLTQQTTPQEMLSTGNFSANISSLSANTTYYFWTKAEGQGTAYGDEKSFTTKSVLPGDVNGDGVINALDITKVERIVVGLDPPTAGADANQDGKINALDITKVERIIAGLD